MSSTPRTVREHRYALDRRTPRIRRQRPPLLRGQGLPPLHAAPARARFRRPSRRADRPLAQRAPQLPDDPEHRATRRHRLHVDPPCRPGHRALRRRVVHAEPGVLRPGEDRRTRHRGRVQHGRQHAGRAGRRLAQVRAPHPLPRQTQSQRVDVLPEHLRPDALRLGQAGVRDGRPRRRRDDLLRLRGVAPPDRRGLRVVRGGARIRAGHRALVLHPLRRVQAGQGLPHRRRPHRAGESPRRDDRGRHHQAETAHAQPGLRRPQQQREVHHQGREVRQVRQVDVRQVHPGDHPIDLCRLQVANCFMGRMPW